MIQEQLAIETRNLGKSYGKTVALKSLNLKVPRNSIFGFLGPNGAGKTTVMKLLLGLAKPSSGTGRIFGLDIVHDSIKIRHRIGYLAQNPQFPKQKTVRETLEFSLKIFEGSLFSNKKVDDMLETVGLFDKANRSVGNLSGGELQRLGLAQAQINDPELLILDEPAAALDPLGRNDVLHIMKRLSEKSTIFYSTHILDDVQKVSDTVAILNRGELVAQDSIEMILAGKEGPVYEVILKGDWEPAYECISSEKWVSNIETIKTPAGIKWSVAVNNSAVAEKKLLRSILLHENVCVLDFQKKKYELEEAFIELIKGS